MIARDVIRRKRNGQALEPGQLQAFVKGLVDHSWSDAECGAMTMALFLRGMEPPETVALTAAMAASGDILDWGEASLHGPVLDKHSTGGVGDKVSLVLAPVLAACGAYVPMISGRALGHTGGTLDKLDSIPGYQTSMSVEQLRAVVKTAGCAISGQTERIAPADRRLYALRNLTSTVENIPLITSSILSKKLAAGLQGLVMDVKAGDGAFMQELEDARILARALVETGCGAGLPTRALITDMSHVLGHSAGNAVEVLEAVEVLRGERVDARLIEVTRALAAELMDLGGLAPKQAARDQVDRVLRSGAALERFSRMVHAAGGPADFADKPRDYLAAAPVRLPIRASRAGWVAQAHALPFAQAVLDLGGGRRRAGEIPDPAVGVTDIVPVGTRVEAGQALAIVHARDDAAARLAGTHLAGAFHIVEQPVAAPPPVLEEVVNPYQP